LEDSSKRDIKGRFVKGQHYNRATEFKKGQIPGNYKDGRTLNKRCIDCGTKIDYKATRCIPCLTKTKIGRRPSEKAFQKYREWRLAHPRMQRMVEKDGYVVVYKPDHHYHDRYGYVKEHRLVYEEYHKCCLLSWILIHHKNRNRSDNRIENLEPMTQPKHTSHHFTKDMSDRKCSDCGNNKTRGYWRNGVMAYGWYKDGMGGFICKNCYEVRLRLTSRS